MTQSKPIKSNIQHVTILQLHYYFIMTSLRDAFSDSAAATAATAAVSTSGGNVR